MKMAIFFSALILVVASMFSAAALLAEETGSAGSVASEKAVLVQNAPGSPASENVRPQTAAAAADPKAVGESIFSLEKLIIGLGLCLVIVLAVFRWGTSSHPKKQSK